MPGKIIRDLLCSVRSEIENIDAIKVKRVIIGLGYTAVQLDTEHVGLCYTFSSEIAPDCCQIWRRAGTLAGSPAIKLAELSLSWDLSEAVVGVAALNALSQLIIEKKSDRYVIVEGDLIDQIKIAEDDTVVLVGNIYPFIPKIIDKTRKIFILERNPRIRGANIFPDVASEDILPGATVVIITGTALANGTIDRLLELSRTAREVALVGPTASILPDPLFRHGVTAIGCVRIVDNERILQIVSEGGGTPSFKGACKQIVIRPRRD
ncbi:MAG: DUF364 domain-containing protein [Candidatus Bathyarchaeia archaeon]